MSLIIGLFKFFVNLDLSMLCKYRFFLLKFTFGSAREFGYAATMEVMNFLSVVFVFNV